MVRINTLLASASRGLDQSAAGCSRSGTAATVDVGRLNGSPGVTTFLIVTARVTISSRAATVRIFQQRI